MIAKDKPIEVTNRDTGSVGYTIPDSHIHRSFTAGETKTITFDELEQLSWAPGGKEMLKNYLIINDQEAAEEILGPVEPEYFYTKETVDKLLREGTLDQLEDALEFGPSGVKELIKNEAVDLKLDSSVKREAIQKATNFNVTNAIELSKEDDSTKTNAATSLRRSAPMAANETNSTTSGNSRYRNVIIK